jgi:hypothetical protein
MPDAADGPVVVDALRPCETDPVTVVGERREGENGSGR